jgi:hypothetical protein
VESRISVDHKLATLNRISLLVREGFQFRHIAIALGRGRFRRALATSSMYGRLSNKTLGSIVGVSHTTITRWIQWLDAVPAEVLEAEKRKRIVGRVELKVRPNDYEKLDGKLHYVSRFTASTSLAWLAGFVAGDGSLTRRHVFVYNGVKHLIDHAASIMSEYGTVGRARRRERYEAWLSSHAFSSALGDPDCRRKLLSKPQLAANFAAGLFDAEGWISFAGISPSVHLAMTDKRLLIEVQRAMKDQLGVDSRLRLRVKAGRVAAIGGRNITTRKDFWEFRILSNPFSNVESWARIIGSGLEHPIKRRRALRIIELGRLKTSRHE